VERLLNFLQAEKSLLRHVLRNNNFVVISNPEFPSDVDPTVAAVVLINSVRD